MNRRPDLALHIRAIGGNVSVAELGEDICCRVTVRIAGSNGDCGVLRVHLPEERVGCLEQPY